MAAVMLRATKMNHLLKKQREIKDREQGDYGRADNEKGILKKDRRGYDHR